MTTPPSDDRKAGEISAALRRERQEEKLRENLRRRKDQARARRDPSPISGGEASENPVGMPADVAASSEDDRSITLPAPDVPTPDAEEPAA